MASWLRVVLAAVFGMLIGCAAGFLTIDSRAETETWIIFGGNTDKTADAYYGQLNSTGQIREQNIVKIEYKADVAQMEASTQDALPKGVAAWNKWCSHGQACQIRGFSQGSDPAIAVASAVGAPNRSTRVIIEGAPQPSTGVWHHFYPDHPWVEPFLQDAGFPTNRVPPAGSENFYDQDDPYANLAPQCLNGGAIGSMWVTLNIAHVVQNPAAHHEVWTGPDGVINHEFNAARNPVTVSGRDGQLLGCPPQGWQGP